MFRKWSLIGLFTLLAFSFFRGTLWSLPSAGNQAATRKSASTQPAARKTTKVPQPIPSRGILIRGGEIWTATGKILQNSDLLIRNGKIVAVGKKLKARNVRVIDARGKYVTPGLIDTHSHMGVYAAPHVRATSDGNESARPVTAYAYAERGFWPQDPAIPRAAAGGATTAQILPGSANLIGGRTVTLKLKVKRSVDEMKFPQAPYGLKMACGENPKRVHRGLKTRMGNYAGYRRAFQKTLEYIRRWKRYDRSVLRWQKKKKSAQRCRKKRSVRKKNLGQKPTTTKSKVCKPFLKPRPNPPRLNHGMETLKLVLQGKILVHVHCYRADEMLGMIKLSKEYGFKIRAFHHATDAYKIRDVLAKEKISVSIWADWWGFKLEAFDAIQESAAMSDRTGVKVVIHSDSSLGIQRLNHEAAKAFYRGRAMGLKLNFDDAIRWITINAAWALGIDKYTGSLEPGKMADVVIWDGHPFKVRTRTHTVFIDGDVVFQRGQPLQKTDFEVGLQPKQ